MSIDRYIWGFGSMEEYANGQYVQYEDHAELMADLQRQLDETEALLADAKAAQEELEERLTRAEEDMSDLQETLYTYIDTD